MLCVHAVMGKITYENDFKSISIKLLSKKQISNHKLKSLVMISNQNHILCDLKS